MTALPDMPHPNPALDLFSRVYMPGWRFNLQRVFRRQACGLLELGALASAGMLGSRHFLGRQMVPIERIRGSESRAHDFDGAFRPRAWRMVERWCRVADAWQQGVGLPPVELIRVGEVYFVRDGHHRISVAAALGAREIEAEVTVWQVTGEMPWDEAPRPRQIRPRLVSRLRSAAPALIHYSNTHNA